MVGHSDTVVVAETSRLLRCAVLLKNQFRLDTEHTIADDLAETCYGTDKQGELSGPHDQGP